MLISLVVDFLFFCQKGSKMPSFQAHQGDVFLERVSEIPEGLKQVTPKTGSIIIAYGEVTGHTHAIKPINGFIPANLFDAGAEKFLNVIQSCELVHEEHAPIKLEPGVYRIPYFFNGGTQREYHPEEIRRVMD